MTNLTVTNAYSKGNAKKTLTINGDVEIANFKEGDKKPSAFVQAKIHDGNVSIQTPKGETESLDLSNEKYSVMLKIAASSSKDTDAELSWYDIRDLDNATLGLDDTFVIKKDLKVGILNIYKKTESSIKTWLHIDFEMNNEKNNIDNTNNTLVSKNYIGSNEKIINEFKIKFETMDASNIAKEMRNQISWYSKNETTFSMFDAIPDNKLIDVLKAYNSYSEKCSFLDSIAGETSNSDYIAKYIKEFDSLFVDLKKEYGVTNEELKPRILRVINVLEKGELSEDDKNNINNAKKLLDKDLSINNLYVLENTIGYKYNASNKYVQQSFLGIKYWSSPGIVQYRVNLNTSTYYRQ